MWNNIADKARVLGGQIAFCIRHTWREISDGSCDRLCPPQQQQVLAGISGSQAPAKILIDSIRYAKFCQRNICLSRIGLVADPIYDSRSSSRLANGSGNANNQSRLRTFNIIGRQASCDWRYPIIRRTWPNVFPPIQTHQHVRYHR